LAASGVREAAIADYERPFSGLWRYSTGVQIIQFGVQLVVSRFNFSLGREEVASGCWSGCCQASG
jgi:hypothetical protein